MVFEGALGQVSLDEATDARLTVQAGGVSVGRLAGPAEISTQSGDITIAAAERGSVVLRTQEGDIRIGAAAGISAVLDAGTSCGRVSNSLTRAGTPDLAIHATTTRGDITAHSL